MPQLDTIVAGLAGRGLAGAGIGGGLIDHRSGTLPASCRYLRHLHYFRHSRVTSTAFKA
jgi:hypothetical protein